MNNLASSIFLKPDHGHGDGVEGGASLAKVADVRWQDLLAALGAVFGLWMG